MIIIITHALFRNVLAFKRSICIFYHPEKNVLKLRRPTKYRGKMLRRTQKLAWEILGKNTESLAFELSTNMAFSPFRTKTKAIHGVLYLVQWASPYQYEIYEIIANTFFSLSIVWVCVYCVRAQIEKLFWIAADFHRLRFSIHESLSIQIRKSLVHEWVW